MNIAHAISELTTINSALGVGAIGVVAAWFRPVGWHEQVTNWQGIHKFMPNHPPDPVDPLMWEDPDGFLPFPME